MPPITMSDLMRQNQELRDRIRELQTSMSCALELLDGDHIDQAAAVLQLELEKGGVAHD